MSKTTFNLTCDQQNALEAFNTFIYDPIESVFVLSGYSGCGKSTLVNHILQSSHTLLNGYEVVLTATTNKAAEALSSLVNQSVQTIHSFLGLKVNTDYSTGVTKLTSKNTYKQSNFLIFVDEASYIDASLFNHIFKLTENCKYVFIGDPAQLTPITSKSIPAFTSGFSGAQLTEVVRQAADNPIINLSTQFRHTVNTGKFFSFKPDGEYIHHLSSKDFKESIIKEFTRNDWSFYDSKILAWTNKCVINYNNYINTFNTGNPEFQIGDFAICNSFIACRPFSIKTDQLVMITDISNEYLLYGVLGHNYTINNCTVLFHPNSIHDKNERIKQARKEEDINLLSYIDNHWIDLRAAYACTINKSQGSTYDRVFIDLNDVRRCNSGNQIARMLYVAISRARYQVFLTGDLV